MVLMTNVFSICG